MMKLTEKEVEKELEVCVKKGYLKKTKKGYIDSDRVIKLLKEGKTRYEISEILEKSED